MIVPVGAVAVVILVVLIIPALVVVAVPAEDIWSAGGAIAVVAAVIIPIIIVIIAAVAIVVIILAAAAASAAVVVLVVIVAAIVVISAPAKDAHAAGLPVAFLLLVVIAVVVIIIIIVIIVVIALDLESDQAVHRRALAEEHVLPELGVEVGAVDPPREDLIRECEARDRVRVEGEGEAHARLVSVDLERDEPRLLVPLRLDRDILFPRVDPQRLVIPEGLLRPTVVTTPFAQVMTISAYEPSPAVQDGPRTRSARSPRFLATDTSGAASVVIALGRNGAAYPRLIHTYRSASSRVRTNRQSPWSIASCLSVRRREAASDFSSSAPAMWISNETCALPRSSSVTVRVTR